MFGLRILDLSSHLISHEARQYLKERLVEANGVEPMTLCVQGRCSSQLSYAPEYCRSINQADIIAKSYHQGLSFTRTKV